LLRLLLGSLPLGGLPLGSLLLGGGLLHTTLLGGLAATLASLLISHGRCSSGHGLLRSLLLGRLLGSLLRSLLGNLLRDRPLLRRLAATLATLLLGSSRDLGGENGSSSQSLLGSLLGRLLGSFLGSLLGRLLGSLLGSSLAATLSTLLSDGGNGLVCRKGGLDGLLDRLDVVALHLPGGLEVAHTRPVVDFGGRGLVTTNHSCRRSDLMPKHNFQANLTGHGLVVHIVYIYTYFLFF